MLMLADDVKKVMLPLAKMREHFISVTQCIEPKDLEHSDEIETLWTEGESVNYTTIVK